MQNSKFLNLSNIILLRHGQTQWNLQKRYQGHLNSNLTQLGKEQVESNAQKIKKLSLDWQNIPLYSSPLGRAQESSMILVKALEVDEQSILFDDRLQEFNYGIFQGKTYEEVKILYPEILQQREANKWHYQLPDGESYALVSKRVEEWLLSLPNQKWIIVVAHEMLNRTLRGLYCGLNEEQTLSLRQPNDKVLLLKDANEEIIE